MHRRSVEGVALSLVLGAAACGEEVLPDVETAYYDVYLDDEVRACGRQLDDYDRFTDRVFQFWTGGDPGDFHAEVHVTRDPCRETGRGCARHGEAWLTRQIEQYHELVHVMHYAIDGRSAPSVSEGVAEAMGSAFPYIGGPWVGASMDMLFAEGAGDVDYDNAAMLTRFLIEEHGVDAFRTYSRAMVDREQRAPEDFEREFAAAFGEPLDAAWPAYVSEPEARCTYDFWYCDERRPVELPYETAIECDDPDVLGFDAPPYSETDSPYHPIKIVHLELEEPRTIRFEIDNVYADVGRCGSCREKQLEHVDGDAPTNISGPAELELRAGTWAFVVHAEPDKGSPRFAMTPAE